MQLTSKARLGDLYDHPVGRDAINKILLDLRKPRWLVDNPVVRRLPCSALAWLERRLAGTGVLPALLGLLNTIDERPSDGPGPGEHPWWRSAVFYQIYPRSFLDSDGDGIGDIRGIIQRIDYLHDLGIDCLWLSPIFASPNEDMGYDVSDYRAVMDEMGTLADVDELIAACHERGMRIILDLVANHTSAEHEWFKQAAADPSGPYGDYYVFRDGTPDTPPNNWVSYFSGPAWRWLPGPRKWALRLFAPGQPDLNWENAAVRREIADVVQWWLARGIDGFRLDVINFISKRPGLADGDPTIGALSGYPGIEHYFHGPRLHEFLRELRRDGFTRPGDGWAPAPGRDPVGVMIGETPGVGVQSARLLTGWDRAELDLTFLFDHLNSPGRTRWTETSFDLEALKQHYVNYHRAITGNDWIAVFWENHDNPRMTSKVDGRDEARTPVAKLLATLLLTMRGTPFIFQGQELGAANQDFRSRDDFRDIETLNRWSELEAAGEDPFAGVITGSRDHARTPMRWDDTPTHGFTTGQPWIGFYEESSGYTVAEQAADEDSVLSYYRQLIRLRRQHPALTVGEIEFLDVRLRHYFGYLRRLGDETFLVELNLSDRPLSRPKRALTCAVLAGTCERRGPTMAPYEATVSRVVPARKAN
ncbi:alpha-glucosidase [Tessaracoccus sp. OH4464_COT-324]|uniref:glycoside hydrolase family 13 protein n=1 Tax=Tessaracoccus sp. OH4464_COT-324 TaxID=2491059 RepID=UPI000F63DFF3|nr:alpha-glucosidase [Tessaracoccus sp. OH4464_COT-324]RRD46337.1 alpha-glucosidase [Tessaracoccus sp. OH4464_COT-324]